MMSNEVQSLTMSFQVSKVEFGCANSNVDVDQHELLSLGKDYGGN